MWTGEETTYGLKMPLGLEVEEGFTCSVWSIEPVGKVLARDLPNPRNAYAIRL